MRRALRDFLAAAGALLAAGPLVADDVSVEGALRTRFEALDGQFRLGLGGADQALALRTSLRAHWGGERFEALAELLDARAYLTDSGSLVGTGVVNTRDVLQAWLGLEGRTERTRHTLRFGRMTLDLASRRLVARNRFRNTINAFSGAHWRRESEALVLQGFAFLPVLRRPAEPAAARDNDFAWDRQTTDLRFTGLHGTWRPDAWRVDAFAYDLDERDSAGRPSRDRDYWTAGVRWRLAPRAGRPDAEVELVLQEGTVSASLLPGAVRLDHSARFAHFELGYAFRGEGLLRRVAFQYDHASGDEDPGDGESNRFDTLFGARRFDFNPTGIYGPFARSNLVSPGLRVEFQPAARISGMAALRRFRLEAARDSWTTAGLRDATGAAGNELGTQLEVRLRWELPRGWRLEGGAAYLEAGSFPERVGSRVGASRYGYTQLSVAF